MATGEQADEFANVMETLVRHEQRMDEFEERLDAIEQAVAENREATQLLNLVEDVDVMDAKQRSVALLQHMQRKIRANGRDRLFLDRDDAEDALHHPDVDRTTIYTDMDRCERLVGDKDVCWYVSKSESPVDQAIVYLDLGAGDVPARYSIDSVHGGV